MSLIGIHSISKAFGTVRLFEKISFTIAQGDRIGLIGPNGAGKSSLLKILMAFDTPDDGSISRRQGLRIGYASQAPEFPLLPVRELLLKNSFSKDPVESMTHANILLGKALFQDPMAEAATLSGGWKKRLDIVRALMGQPDILLLDEPTNHLDLEGIFWLEKFLTKEKSIQTYLVVSHDRYFLERVTNKIIELNPRYPQGLFICEGTLSTFFERREQFFEAQAQQERGLASTVREEVDWLSRSAPARTSKSRARIQKANELIEELSVIQRRNVTPKVSVEFVASERETRKLLATKNLSKAIGDRPLFKGIDITLSPGSRLGIVGDNGTGKTTLLKILAGLITPDIGTIKYADNLRLVYFDQMREQIPLDISLRQALAGSNDYVTYREQRIHVNGWAKKFLLSPDRLALPVRYLSGGERARIQIAKLMLEPADILFLDEPTNDLDITTLEVIEESLLEFMGAVVLISHDRHFMDRLCTQVIGLGKNNEHSIFADYTQWLSACVAAPRQPPSPKAQPQPPKLSNKLSYKEQRELAEMDQKIASVETTVTELEHKLASITDADEMLVCYQLLADAHQQRESLFERWLVLEDKKKCTPVS